MVPIVAAQRQFAPKIEANPWVRKGGEGICNGGSAAWYFAQVNAD